MKVVSSIKENKNYTRKCCVLNCSNFDDGNYEAHFHKFPKNENIRNQWLEKLNLTLQINYNNMYVCSKHFEDNFYVKRCNAEGKLNRLYVILLIFAKFKKGNFKEF